MVMSLIILNNNDDRKKRRTHIYNNESKLLFMILKRKVSRFWKAIKWAGNPWESKIYIIAPDFFPFFPINFQIIIWFAIMWSKDEVRQDWLII